MKIHMVILAAGIGKRMTNEQIPKQFLKIGQYPIIIHTIRQVIESELFDSIYIVIHPNWTNYLKKLLSDNKINENSLHFISGGKERIDSIENALNELKNKGTDFNDIVLIHDGVRPFIGKNLLSRCINTTKKHGATIASIPVKDTIMVIEQGVATETPERKKLFCTQTPAGFQFSIIYNAVKNLGEKERKFATGIAQICQMQNIPVYTYPGEDHNIKITTPTDLILGEMILTSQK